MIKYIQKCRSCSHSDLKHILNLGFQSIQGSFVYPNKPAPSDRKIDSNILICNVESGGCGLVQNQISIAPEILYSNYGYRSSVSNTMKTHLTDIVRSLSILTSLYGKKDVSVLDIGCNDGYMLKQYSEHYKKYGVDPSDIANEIKDKNITVINKCFPCKDLEDKKFNIITSIACFYDIENPNKFCENIKNNLKNDGVWIVEFAYLSSVLDNLAYDGMVHEHLTLYSIDSFERIIKKNGLKIFRLQENDTNGGSLQAWLTHENNNLFDNQIFQRQILELKIKEFDKKLDDLDTYKNFEKRVAKHKINLYEIIKKLKEEGKNIHIYGMSTKLNTILNYCNIGPDLIEFAAERSPEKWGASTIGGIKMISEEESRKTANVYLVGPYHFKKEILEREQETIERGVKFLFPLPEIEII